jgi:protein-S-isoprenylcysteine O-methyltransferase Ste14
MAFTVLPPLQSQRLHNMFDPIHFGPLAAILLRVPVPWVFVLTYLAGAGVETVFHRGGFFWDFKSLTPAGWVIFTLGAGLAAWGWIIFRRARTTRVPGEVSTTLVTTGPYRLMRNPMYVGLSLAYIGEAAILHHIVPLIFLPLTIAYLNRVVIPLEEAKLHTVFGAEYERYQNDVRRWF